MICIKTHLSFNRTLLLAIGLWPYQQSKFVRLQIILIYSIFINFIIHQLVTFVTIECSSDLIIETLSSTLFCTTLMIQYNSFWINIESVKYLLEQLQYVYNELKDENEIAIIKKYANNARIYTVVLSLLCISLICILILLSSWSRIFGMEPSSKITLQMKQHFIDGKRYLYLFLSHGNAALYIGMIVIIATGTLLISYLQYACGMFKIASYRVEQAITIDTVLENTLEKRNLIHKNLIYAIDMHRKAMNFSNLSVSRFKVMFSFLIIVGVICVSLNIFRVFHIVTFASESDQPLLAFVFLIFHITYLFVGNYVAQQIINHNNHVFTSVYNVRWYIAPLYIQRMILFMLQRSNKAFNLNIGGLFVGSMEGATTLTSASISYFTFLYSTQ